MGSFVYGAGVTRLDPFNIKLKNTFIFFQSSSTDDLPLVESLSMRNSGVGFTSLVSRDRTSLTLSFFDQAGNKDSYDTSQILNSSSLGGSIVNNYRTIDLHQFSDYAAQSLIQLSVDNSEKMVLFQMEYIAPNF